MVSSPVQNLSDFLKNKPPLVIFVLCLLVITVSTFYFAFKVESDGPSLNIDKKHDWLSMRKHFNKLDTCIKLSTWTNVVIGSEDKERLNNELSVFTKISFDNVDYLKPFSQINGALSLQGWSSTTCQDAEKQPKNVEIFFDVPPEIKHLNGSYEVCVTIKGPAEFLPLLKDKGCKPVDGSENKNLKITKGFLSSKQTRVYNPKFCSDGNLAQISFDLNEPDVQNYLNDDVRTEIYIHLMWCSYFLVFVIFCILLYAILKKSEYWEKKEQSARLL